MFLSSRYESQGKVTALNKIVLYTSHEIFQELLVRMRLRWLQPTRGGKRYAFQLMAALHQCFLWILFLRCNYLRVSNTRQYFILIFYLNNRISPQLFKTGECWSKLQENLRASLCGNSPYFCFLCFMVLGHKTFWEPEKVLQSAHLSYSLFEQR